MSRTGIGRSLHNDSEDWNTVIPRRTRSRLSSLVRHSTRPLGPAGYTATRSYAPLLTSHRTTTTVARARARARAARRHRGGHDCCGGLSPRRTRSARRTPSGRFVVTCRRRREWLTQQRRGTVTRRRTPSGRAIRTAEVVRNDAVSQKDWLPQQLRGTVTCVCQGDPH